MEIHSSTQLIIMKLVFHLILRLLLKQNLLKLTMLPQDHTMRLVMGLMPTTQ